MAAPKIKILDIQPDRLSFDLSNTDISMANSLRRVMIAEVPILTIDLVNFEENTTVLQDEFIAHRLGLIPLRSKKPMKEWNYNHACNCGDFCDLCSVKITLECDFQTLYEKNYINASEEQTYDNEIAITITSRDLVSHHPDVEVVHFSNPEEERKSHDAGIMITKLGPGQKIKLEAIAKKGIGKEHAKWSPVSTVALKHHPIVKLNEEILNDYTPDQMQALVECCPANVYALDSSTNSVFLANPSDCMFCKECLYTIEDFRKNPEDDLGVSVSHSTTNFNFTVETTGALTAKEVITESFVVLSDKITRLKNILPNFDRRVNK